MVAKIAIPSLSPSTRNLLRLCVGDVRPMDSYHPHVVVGTRVCSLRQVEKVEKSRDPDSTRDIRNLQNVCVREMILDSWAKFSHDRSLGRRPSLVSRLVL